MIIRSETSEDYAAIRLVNELAFGQRDEADLVDALRMDAEPFYSYVAFLDDRIVGHICLTSVQIEDCPRKYASLGIEPLAVLPEYQNHGIGARLVQYALQRSREMGYDLVVVQGFPWYYPHFGFVPAVRKGLRSEYHVPEDAFMVAELRPGILDNVSGLVRFHPVFHQIP